MRRPAFSWRFVACVATLLAGAAATLPGCGDGGSGKGGDLSPALAAALSYLPRDVAIAAVVPTDLDRAPLKRLEKRASKLEGWGDLEKEFEKQVSGEVDFDRDIRPQLGNPLVVSASSLDQSDDLEYSALQVKDPEAMRRLLERGVARGQEERLPDYKGALLTRDLKKGPGEKDETGNTFTAVHRNVAVQASSKEQLEAAIERSAGGDNLASNDEIASELDRGGEDVLFRVAGDSAALLKRARGKEAEAARKVEWVTALGDFTGAGFAMGEGLRFEFEQKTDKQDLSESDLPLAAGAEPALLHDQDAPIVAGLREPDQLYTFLERALKATEPRQYAEYETAIKQLAALGTDIHDDVLEKITNLSLALTSDQAGSFQTNLSEGAGEDLRKFLEVSGPFFEGALGSSEAGRVRIVTRGSGDSKVWTVQDASRKPVARYTVRGNALVGSLGSAELPDPVEGAGLPGAEGALAVALLGKRFIELVRDLDQQGTPTFRDADSRRALRLISTLASLRLSIRAETDALTGRGEFVLPSAR
jgi:uncharacterized protein DUF3352